MYIDSTVPLSGKEDIGEFYLSPLEFLNLNLLLCYESKWQKKFFFASLKSSGTKENFLGISLTKEVPIFFIFFHNSFLKGAGTKLSLNLVGQLVWKEAETHYD